jgi:hypothetical protein
MSQFARSPEAPGTWFMFDRSARIAITRYVEIRGHRLLRSVAFDRDRGLRTSSATVDRRAQARSRVGESTRDTA